jgi:hypothetical protein
MGTLAVSTSANKTPEIENNASHLVSVPRNHCRHTVCGNGPIVAQAVPMRMVLLVVAMVVTLQNSAEAGISVEAGLTGTRTSGPVASGAGTAFTAAWWFRDSLAVSLANKEVYLDNDDVLSHFAVGVSALKRVNTLGLRGAVNLVHAHEQITSQVWANPLATLLGVGTGTHHRAGASLAVDLVIPFHQRNNHEWFAAAGVDATVYLDDHGARWLWSTRATLGIMFGAPAAGR